MDHNNTPLHWGYSGAPPQNTWVPPPTTRASLKRALSESDCDDAYSEESSKETSPGGNDSCQMLTRKKRRGVIEKKRRDRINCSLSELKRLVPTAYEKQGSAKLEKAEILQLTVDHLKTLKQGIDPVDTQRYAMDYHIMGFRECASEVARYLVSIEGMEQQNPLRVRLLSHLQCFVAQRELSAKPGASPNWIPGNYQTGYSIPPTYQAYPTQSNVYVPNLPTPVIPHSLPLEQHQLHSTSHSSTSTNTTSTLSNHTQAQIHESNHQHYSGSHETHQELQEPTYTDLSSSVHRASSASLGYSNPEYPPGSAQGYAHGQAGVYNGNKPYRPWGAELAY